MRLVAFDYVYVRMRCVYIRMHAYISALLAYNAAFARNKYLLQIMQFITVHVITRSVAFSYVYLRSDANEMRILTCVTF